MNNSNRKKQATYFSRRLGEVDKHWPVEWIVSLRVVPDMVTLQSVALLVNQNIPADTCVHSTVTHVHWCCRWWFLQAALTISIAMQKRTQGPRGPCTSQWLHDGPQLTILQGQERPSWVLKTVESLWAVGARTEPRLGAHSAPQIP